MQWTLIILRKNAGLSQDEMAKHLGISKDGYGKKERGEFQFTADEMFLIADYFGKTLDEIFLRRNFGNTEQTK